MKGQMIAVGLVMACGLAMMIMTRSLILSLTSTRDAYYSEYGFGEVFADLKRAPNSVRSRLADISGVAAVKTRVTGSLTLLLPGLDEPADGTILSIPASQRQRVPPPPCRTPFAGSPKSPAPSHPPQKNAPIPWHPPAAGKHKNRAPARRPARQRSRIPPLPTAVTIPSPGKESADFAEGKQCHHKSAAIFTIQERRRAASPRDLVEDSFSAPKLAGQKIKTATCSGEVPGIVRPQGQMLIP